MSTDTVRIGFDGTRVHAVVRLDGVDRTSAIAAFTDPHLVQQWWGGARLRDAVQRGGEYVVHFPALGQTMRGEVLDHCGDSVLGFTWHWDHEPDAATREVWVHATSAINGTRLELTHHGYGNTDADRLEAESHRTGWAFFLPRLAAVLAG